eukprot:CAMPEP_0175100102 /NCGR_PEP_ID=MMETSP0086_2-20121207/6879_1 /TAXON_ID=136419 /ORGANISM="Unknown Unknown, Strain D1" /LENGTH=71 /DNA_ID=CAMNT_0016374133 /DNA_START=58 /DNA_END=273 /DNA_ORIENTATION=-
MSNPEDDDFKLAKKLQEEEDARARSQIQDDSAVAQTLDPWAQANAEWDEVEQNQEKEMSRLKKKQVVGVKK